jgi:NADH dehydrogenase/NADH:ubiquinone oxidoreductase subunit G
MSSISALAQQDTVVADHEIKAEVPELSSFHKVIYKLWHTAWPNKDVAMLADLALQIDSGATKIENAKLPGILRDKKDRWEENVKKLREIVTSYQDAIAKKDSQLVLDAAEKLHSQYETLVRVIRPMIKELDAFHQVLYRLYHYYMPEYDLPKIRESVDQMKEKMEALNKATLPERLKKRHTAFDNKRKELDNSLKKLAGVVKVGKDKKKVKVAIITLHSKYQALENVFD